MLRLTQVKLPLDHPEGDIKAAILSWTRRRTVKSCRACP